MSDNSVGGASSAGSGMGAATGSLQRGVSSHSTPRATPRNPSPEVIRIYVPYSPLDTPIPSPHNGDLQSKVPCSFLDANKIRIKIDNDELPTPLVEHGRIKTFRVDSPVDLK